MDQQLFDSSRMPSPVVKQEQNGIAYYYQDRGYSFRVFYEIRDGWKFLTKSLQIIDAPSSSYTVKQIEPVRIYARHQDSEHLHSGGLPSPVRTSRQRFPKQPGYPPASALFFAYEPTSRA